MLLEDLLRRLGRHLLDFHAAFAGNHQDRFGGRAVHDDAQVQLASDVAAFFDQHLANGLARRTGLDGHQAVAQHPARRRGGFFGTADQLDAALFGELLNLPLAAAARMDLGLDHGQRPAQFSKRLGGVIRRRGHDAAQDRYARVAKDLLGLEFVDFHRERPNQIVNNQLGTRIRQGSGSRPEKKGRSATVTGPRPVSLRRSA